MTTLIRKPRFQPLPTLTHSSLIDIKNPKSIGKTIFRSSTGYIVMKQIYPATQEYLGLPDYQYCYKK